MAIKRTKKPGFRPILKINAKKLKKDEIGC
jgi:hypothetical protein